VTTTTQASNAPEQESSAVKPANKERHELLARMSHELRTPLNAVLGFGQLLERHLQGTDQVESARQIVRAGRHLLNIIDGVLDIARTEVGELSMSREAVPVAVAIDEAVLMSRPLADAAGVTLIVTGGAAGQYVLADRRRLQQILLNLISNAVKYNHQGGAVWLSWTLANMNISIAVRDDGPGIALNLHNRLFTPFDRLGAETSDIEGTGIGLAVTRGLAELMNGAVSVASEVGQGSTFSVSLPLSPGSLGPIPKEMLADSVDASDPSPKIPATTKSVREAKVEAPRDQ
jgi:signal transduction histidine kinase